MPLTVGAISESMSAEQVVNILTGSYSQEDHIDHSLLWLATNYIGGTSDQPYAWWPNHITITQEVKQLHKLLQVFGHGYPHQDVL